MTRARSKTAGPKAAAALPRSRPAVRRSPRDRPVAQRSSQGEADAWHAPHGAGGLAASQGDPAVSPQALRDGAAELGLAPSDAQFDRLQRFAALLLRWNRVHNLTALEQPQQVLSHHLLDSLAIVAPLRDIATAVEAGGRAPRVLDVGAGGGLPGLPLAIALPEWRFTLLDKVAKKTAFLTQAALELQLGNVEVATARVEDWRAPPFDVVVARAYASLAELVRGTHALLAPGGHWCAMKGAVPLHEIAELERAPARVVRTIRLQVPRLDAERHLIVLAPR